MLSYVVCLSLALLIGLAPRAEAQFTHRNRVSVDGQVEANQSVGLQVVLSGAGEMDRRADIGSSGVFNFPDLPAGQYELTVTTLYGDVIHREFVVLNEMMNHISVRLPEQKVARPPSGTRAAPQPP